VYSGVRHPVHKVSKKSSKRSFLQKQESILPMKILDSSFHGNDKIKELDSRFHGNDRIVVVDSCSLYFCRERNDKIKELDTCFLHFREDENDKIVGFSAILFSVT